jgi:hypothetical protein
LWVEHQPKGEHEMYLLINKMNDSVFSRHRTLKGMARAERNAQPTERGAYLPLAPRNADGSRLAGEDVDGWIQAQADLYYED